MIHSFRALITYLVITTAAMYISTANAANYRQAMDLIRNGSFQQAHRQFVALSQAGNANAQFQLGLMAHLGRGVPKNFVDARKWYSEAANAGEVRAQNNLGVIFRDGLGIPVDLVEAYKWFSLAAAQQNSHATVNLRGLLNRIDTNEIRRGQALAQEHFDRFALSQNKIASAPRKTKLTPTKINRPKVKKPSLEMEAMQAQGNLNIGPAAVLSLLKTVLEPNNKKVETLALLEPRSTSTKPSTGKFYIQLGLFRSLENVKRIYSKVNEHGITIHTEKISLGGNLYRKLLVGPYQAETKAKTMAGLLNRILSIRSLVFYQDNSNQAEAAFGTKKRL